MLDVANRSTAVKPNEQVVHGVSERTVENLAQGCELGVIKVERGNQLADGSFSGGIEECGDHGVLVGATEACEIVSIHESLRHTTEGFYDTALNEANDV
ncbi:hypothetical protein [Rhodopirellula halodulae]|uniref:hypothetical protein n=1 Tax=Rhodopirellula halodulae TaxID=2894198 RepID=UPI001E60A8CA|nr:hypothetical protein [Rhodopirellula sp. JC737]MCC9657966.1 hypothetical protein [Rhodopirellula sp. JC737]